MKLPALLLLALCAPLLTLCPAPSQAQKSERIVKPAWTLGTDQGTGHADQKPELVVQTGHSSSIQSVSFSPDGKVLASGSMDETIKIWDTATGQEIRTFTGHTRGVNSVAFSPDGKTVASGSTDSTIKLWDVATGQLLKTLRGHRGIVTSVSFSPDGETLASGGGYGDCTVRLWDTAAGQLLKTITGDIGVVNSVSFSPDGKTLASGSIGHNVRLWDIATGQESKTFTGRTGWANCVAFSPDGKTVASGDSDFTGVGSAVNLWDVATGRLLRTFMGHIGSVESVAFSPDGGTLASGSLDSTIKLWDAATGQSLKTLTGHANFVKAATFSPDGRTLASGSWDNTIKLWDVATGQNLATLTGHRGSMPSVSFGPNGKVCASESLGSTVNLWDMSMGQLLKTLTVDNGVGVRSSLSPDGKILASRSRDKTIKVWDVATGQLLKTLPEEAEFLCGECFSPDGKTLASAGRDRTINLWDVATGQLLKTLTGNHLGVTSLSFSPDGGLLASGGDMPFKSSRTTLKIWDVATGQLLKALTGHSLVLTVSFSPDGKTIASGSGDGTVNLWGVAAGENLATLTGHIGSVESVSFSPDGRTLASGGLDHAIKLWDVATGQSLKTLIGHTNAVTRSSFSPDGRTLASESRDHTIRFWDVATGRNLATLTLLNQKDWAVVTPDGRFDTGNLDNIRDIHWVLPDQPFTPVPVEAFFAQYYTPGLLTRLMNRDPLPPLPDISQINHVQPQVAIDSVAPHPGGDPALVDVTVSYAGRQADALNPDGTKKTETSGVYDLRLFRNGQLVASLPEDAAPGAAPVDLSGGTVGKTQTHTFTVRLAQDGAKSVAFTTYAFNGDKVKSQTASRDYVPPTPLPVVKGRAWVLAFGVNAYSDPRWDLRYAAADARAFGAQLVPRLRKTGEYSQVTFVPLVSDTGNAAPDTLPATKAALRATLAMLAGRLPDAQDAPFTSALQKMGVGRASPEDMVLLAFSCHGDTDAKTGEYYLFPADIGPDQSHGLTPDLEAHSLSSAELTAWMQGVDAGEMAMVIDSCHSAAAAGQAFKPGPMDSPGLGQLAYYKRMRILSASAADAVAKEYPDLGHGLLTAALVGDGLVNGGAKPAPGQTALTVGPWLTFAEGDVPKLDARENGQRRAGHKATAPVEGKAEAADDGLQKPSLFDFHRAGARDAAVCVDAGKAP